MTPAHTNTATRIANPSIQAVPRWELSAVAVSMIMDAMAATINILRVKSSRALKRISKNFLAGTSGILLLPNQLQR